jgi:hypothetical protein
MQLPFANPVAAALLFLQALLLFLRFVGVNQLENQHWGIVLIPTFIAQFFLIALLASEALYANGKRKKNPTYYADLTATTASHLLLEMVTGVLILLTTALFVFYLDDDTELPLYWITTSFLGATILFFITMIVICFSIWEEVRNDPSKNYGEPGETRKEKGLRAVFCGFLIFVQGFFLWLYNSPWGRVFDANLFWIVLPTFLFLIASFIVTIRQTYVIKHFGGLAIVRQGVFILAILLLAVTLLLLVLELEYGLVNDEWIVLPLMIFFAALLPFTLFLTYMKKMYYYTRPKFPPREIITGPATNYDPIVDTEKTPSDYAIRYYVTGQEMSKLGQVTQ